MVTFLTHRKRLRWLCFKSGISSPFNALHWNSQELFTVRRSTSWRSFVVVPQISRDLLALQNRISDVCTLFWSPPRVSRVRTPASFWSQMATFQIWCETVKTQGATLETLNVTEIRTEQNVTWKVQLQPTEKNGTGYAWQNEHQESSSEKNSCRNNGRSCSKKNSCNTRWRICSAKNSWRTTRWRVCS